MSRPKYLVIKRDTGSSAYGHNYSDCKILGELDEVDEAYKLAVANGYMETPENYGGVELLKRVEVKATES